MQGMAVYFVEGNEQDHSFVLKHLLTNYDRVAFPTMHIGVRNNYAFLMTNINKVTQNYSCGECPARFTENCNLSRQ